MWLVAEEQALYVAFLAFLMGEIVGLILTHRWMKPVGLSLLPNRPTKPTLKATFLEAWPFAAAGILGTMVFRIDVVMLREMLPQGGDEMAGLYGAGYRLMESGHFLAASVAAAMFPALVRRRSEEGTLPFDILKRASIGLFSVGFCGGIFLFILADPLLSLLAGAEFSSGAPYLQALAFTVPFTFVNFALGTAVSPAVVRFGGCSAPFYLWVSMWLVTPTGLFITRSMRGSGLAPCQPSASRFSLAATW